MYPLSLSLVTPGHAPTPTYLRALTMVTSVTGQGKLKLSRTLGSEEKCCVQSSSPPAPGLLYTLGEEKANDVQIEFRADELQESQPPPRGSGELASILVKMERSVMRLLLYT